MVTLKQYSICVALFVALFAWSTTTAQAQYYGSYNGYGYNSGYASYPTYNTTIVVSGYVLDRYTGNYYLVTVGYFPATGLYQMINVQGPFLAYTLPQYSRTTAPRLPSYASSSSSNDGVLTTFGRNVVAGAGQRVGNELAGFLFKSLRR